MQVIINDTQGDDEDLTSDLRLIADTEADRELLEQLQQALGSFDSDLSIAIRITDGVVSSEMTGKYRG